MVDQLADELLKRASEELQEFISEEREPDADSPLELLWMEKGAEPHKAFIADVVQPLWKKLASDLNTGRYDEVRTVLQRVDERREKTAQYISQFRNGANYAGAIIRILQQQATENGEETKIGLVINESQGEDGINWGVVQDGGAEPLPERISCYYEVYGYVREIYLPEQRRPLDSDVIEIIKYGLSLNITFKSMSQLLDQIGEDKPEYGKRATLRRKLIRYDLYPERKKKGPGSPRADLEKVLEVWRIALSRSIDRH